MKLVEILARDVKEWLDCWVSAVQDSDGTVWFNLEDNVGPIFDADRSWVSNPCHSEMFNVSSDFQTAIVTRAQWEAERARILKMDPLVAARDNPPISQYEQELWDRVAASSLSGVIAAYTDDDVKNNIAHCFEYADAFMAERAKRLKQ